MATDAEVDAIRRSVDLVAYVGQYLELKKAGAEYRALCPFHPDRNPSLSINSSKQVWACFACGAHEQNGADLFGFVRSYFQCSFPEAIARLQNGDGANGAGEHKPIIRPPLKQPPPRKLLIPPVGSLPELQRGDLGVPIKVWTICTPEGAPWLYEARYMRDGQKETRYFSYGRYAEGDPPRWECKHPTNPRPFYGLEQLAQYPTSWVWIHEAPKKVEAAALLFPGRAHLGMLGGANSARYMDLEPLKGRRIVLLPDNDQPGREAMSELAMRLKLIAAELKRIDPSTQPDGSDSPPKWDIADADGWTPEEALAWAKARTIVYAAPQPEPSAEPLIEAPTQTSTGESSLASPAPGASPDTPGTPTAPSNGSAVPPVLPQLSPQERALKQALQGIVYTCIADVQAEAVKWLWPGRIPLGELTMVVGDPGLGKSQICASLASVVTNGGQWPVTRERCNQGSVLILSAEDNVKHTIRPRLDAAGADVTRCHTLQAIKRQADDGSTYDGNFNLAEDLAKLSILMHHLKDVRLVIIDPVSAYLGETDSHKNAEVRGMLAPLTTLAGQHGAAIILVSHLTKSQSTNALMRVQGSIAFAALCRAVWGVARDQENQDRRLFMPLKNNLGEDRTGLAYSIESYTLDNAEPIPTSRILWESALVDKGAEEVFGSALTHEERTVIDDAKQFLHETLESGPVKSSDLERAANAAGHNRTAIFRAKKAMNIQAKREGGLGKLGVWYWQLPPAKSERDDPPESWVPD